MPISAPTIIGDLMSGGRPINPMPVPPAFGVVASMSGYQIHGPKD